VLLDVIRIEAINSGVLPFAISQEFQSKDYKMTLFGALGGYRPD
jgi:hypothetical protein